VRAAFVDIRQRFPHSSLALLSPLAEGADRLAARIAVELGIDVVVPLPLPLALYEQDFESAESRAEFHALLGRARAHIDLPLLPGSTAADVSRPGPARDQEYAKVGAYIASQSQILFALWDGSTGPDTAKVGGTGQVVRFRLEGIPPPYEPARGPLSVTTSVGPVRWIVTPRRGHTSPLPHALEQHVLLPPGRTAESFDRLCERMDLFNRDAARFRVKLDRGALDSKAELLQTEERGAPVPLAALPAACARILDQYAVADGLALHFSKKTLRASRDVFVGVAVAAFCFNVHSNFFSVGSETHGLVARLLTLPWFLLLFLACSTLTAVWIHGRAKRGEYQTKYQDYRALAEALRIQFLWTVTGVRASVVDSYLRKQRSELDWIRGALRAWHVTASAAPPSEARADEVRAAAQSLTVHWIQDQRRYFASKVMREQRQLDKETRIVTALLKASGALTIALGLALTIPAISSPALPDLVRRLVPSGRAHASLMVIIPMLAVVAGVLHGYGEQLGRAEHIRQFGRMADLFEAAGRELERLLEANDQAGITNLVCELGIEALEENGEWLTLHRERPLEVPAG
jgi:hypothetical protein